jgi:hypothetical protein
LGVLQAAGGGASVLREEEKGRGGDALLGQKVLLLFHGEDFVLRDENVVGDVDKQLRFLKGFD